MVVEILYPKLCNLFGDRGNVIYLKKCLPEATFIETELNDVPYFVNHKVDLIYLGPSTESAQEKYVERLSKYRDCLEELINNGTYFLLTGNAVEVFGKEVTDKNGVCLKGLGLVDLSAERDYFGRKNTIYLGKYHDYEVVGFKSQFTLATSDEQPLFTNEKGFGLNLQCPTEGIRKNNLIATYLLGPMLVLNPLFTEELLKQLGVQSPKVALDELTMEAYKLRVEDFKAATKMSH